MKQGTSSKRCVRAAVLVASNMPLEIRDFPLSGPEEGEVLVRVSCCTICGSDIHAFTGRRESDFLPAIVGHEIAGVVDELGPSPPTYWSGEPIVVGDRITFSMTASCGTCFYCTRAGLPQKCVNLFKYGHAACTTDRALTGGLSEYVFLVSGTSIFKIPDMISDEVAATSMCAGATLANAFEGTQDQDKASVVLVGMGMLGLWAIRTAIKNGFSRILCLDVDQDRLEFSRESGATDVLDVSNLETMEVADRVSSYLGGVGADLVIEMSGTAQGVRSAFLSTRTGGQLSLVGSVIPAGHIEVDPYEVVRRSLVIKGVHNYRPDHLASALRLGEDKAHHESLRRGVSKPVPLTLVDRAFQDAIEHRSHRIMVTP